MTHRPQRFQVYTELSDGTGFRIKGSDHIFRYDRNGGWYDEEDNYYNSNGEPATPESLSSSHEESRSDHELSDADDQDFFDDIARQYDYREDQHDDHVEESDGEVKDLEQIDRNVEQLTQYPNNKPLRVFYSNIEWALAEQKIRQLYSDINILAVVQDFYDGKKNGRGYFVVADKAEAKKIVQLEGKAKVQRPISYKVEKLTELLADPIPQQYLKGGAGNKAESIVPSKEEPELPKPAVLKPSQPKSQPKVEPSKPAVAPAVVSNSAPTDKQVSYEFDLCLFKNSDDFKQWMKSFGLSFQTDYRNLKRVQAPNKPTVGWVTMRSSLHHKVHLQLHDGKPIEFKLHE